MRAEIEVSEPWDFPETGVLAASVLRHQAESVLVRLDVPTAYAGRSWGYAKLTPRHLGGAFLAGGASIPSNVLLTAAEDSEGDTAGPFALLVGSVRLIDGAD